MARPHGIIYPGAFYHIPSGGNFENSNATHSYENRRRQKVKKADKES
jgi:hypothetical protein